MAKRNGVAAKLVIFDCDGVLVDSEPIAAASLAAELANAGFATTPEQCVADFTGLSLDSVIARVEARSRRRLPAGFRERLRARDYAAFRESLQPVPGVRALLDKLATPRCVASSGSLEKLDVTLSATGLLDEFAPNIFSAEQVERGKPAPDLFLYAAASMGISPRDCVVVEDSVAGIMAACAAGMDVIGFAGGGHAGDGYASRLYQAGAPSVVERMDELQQILR